MWTSGSLLIIIGAFLSILFVLSNETLIVSLLPYSLGFLIIGLVTLILGSILTIISAYGEEEFDSKIDNKKKIRIVLITVTVLHMILLGYLMIINTEWEIRPLIISIFSQSYAFYQKFSISNYDAFFTIFLLFGIIFIPIIIIEMGFLKDSEAKQINELDKENYRVKKKIKAPNRFLIYLRKFRGSIEKYEFPIGFVFSILGSCFVILPYFILIDSELMLDPKTHLEYYEPYYGFVRGQFLIFGLFFLIIGMILIFYYIRQRYSVNQ